MLSDDMFRSALAPVVAGLAQWADTLAGVAAAEHGHERGFWRLALSPASAAACPLELIVHDRQTFDVAIGPESYEGLPLDDLDGLLPLLQAIAAGRVVTRSWTTPATGMLAAVETLVDVDRADGRQMWQGARMPTGMALAQARAVCRARDRHYAPYDRAATAAASG